MKPPTPTTMTTPKSTLLFAELGVAGGRGVLVDGTDGAGRGSDGAASDGADVWGASSLVAVALFLPEDELLGLLEPPLPPAPEP